MEELLLAGNLLFRVYNPVTGQWSPSWEQAEVDKLEIKTASELVRRISNGRDTYGQSLGGIAVPKLTEFSIVFAAASIEMMRLKLAGETEAINVASATLTDKQVTVVLDKWVEIGNKNLAAGGLTVKNSAGSTTYVLGTDYEINYRLGMIKALSGGGISAGVVKVSGTANAISGTRINGAKRYRNVFEFQLDGINLSTQASVWLHGFQAAVSSDSAHDFMTKGLVTVPLSGELEIPPGKTTSFVLDYPEL